MENFDQYYRSYKYMQKHLATDFTANYLTSNMEDNDKGNDVLSGKLHEKVIDMEWVTEIEDTLPYIEKAIDEQRRFIIENNEIYRIDKAKIINKDSVKHLIQHTNFIDNIDENGKVTPNRVLTIEREDSFETYENRFLITLIETAMNFVSDKYRKMMDAPTDTYNKVEMERDLVLNNQHVTFKMEYSNEVKDAKADDLDVKDYEKLSDFDRVRRIREKLNSFLNTDMMQALKKCIRVKPPINRTNLMTKNPNYKAGLDLFTYLGAYNKPGYEIIGKEFSGKMDKEVQEAVYISQGFQHFMLSISTNPALKRMLEERYQENKTGRGKAGDSEIEERIQKVREEEMKLRLQEIREREKIIRDQKAEIAALKREIEKRDKTIESLKSSIKALEDRIKELENELQQVKAELIKAKERIAELEARVAELEARVAELEAQVAELEAKVAELEKIKAELEAKIAELEQVIEEQKVRIAELEEIVAQQKARIEELEKYVAELENTKAQLEAKVADLEAENAQQKETIKAHEATIATQLAAIAALEGEISTAKSQISELTSTLEQRDATIADQAAQIESLTDNVAKLTAELADEKQAHKSDVENTTKSMQKIIDDADAAHKKEIAEVNQAKDKAISDQQKQFESQIDKIKKSNTQASEAASAKHAAEIKKLQKFADKRVDAAEKSAEKRYEEKAKSIRKQAKDDIKKAEKKANEKTNTAKSKFNALKGSADLIKRDYSFGSIGVIAMMAGQLAASGETNISSVLTGKAKSIRSLAVSSNKKGVSLSSCNGSELKPIKLYKKETNLGVAAADVVENLPAVSNEPVVVTYSGVDKTVADDIAAKIKEAGAQNVSVSQNKSLKSTGLVSIYYTK